MEEKIPSILIVENESIIAHDLEFFIKKHGWHVCGIVATGVEAVTRCRERYPDVVLMDIRLDGSMDGIETAREIGVFSNIPIIYLTALADERTLRRASQTQPHGFVVKPIEDKNLYVSIEMAIYKSRLEQQLKEKEKWLGMILENLDEGVLAADRKGKIQFMNSAAEFHTGWIKSEAEGLPIEIVLGIINEKTGDPAKVSFFKAIMDGEVVELGESTLLKTPDRRLITIDGKWVPVIDERGSITGAMLVFHDITQRKRLENQLQQAKKMEALGALAGGIAHDFNNILSVIQGYTDLALNTAEDNKSSSYIHHVQTATERAKELVKQILSFSRQGEKKLNPLLACVIVGDALRMIYSSLPPTVHLRQNLNAPTSQIVMDPTHLHQVLMNLCTNAAHAMGATGGTLEVSLFEKIVVSDFSASIPKVKPGDYLCLSVRDNGRGIERAVLPRIFEPFFTTRQEENGTGLGLSIVQGIVERYDGIITVESIVDQGTVFYVYIPLFKPTAIETLHFEPTTPGGKERLLFVDDEATFVELGTDLLTQLGYHVTGKTDSLEALKVFSATPEAFDLLIVDLIMPQLTGISLIMRIRDIRPDIPIILCTGFSGHLDEEKVKNVGIGRVILKPLILKEIANAIRDLLDEDDD